MSRKSRKHMNRHMERVESMIGNDEHRKLDENEVKEVSELLYQIEIDILEKLMAGSCEEVRQALIGNLSMFTADMGEYALICYSNGRGKEFEKNAEENLIKLRWMLNGIS